MTDINYAELILTVLSDHAIRGHFGCVCGWRPGLSLNDTESDKRQHRVHQVNMLSDAGLVPTGTEWGVTYEDRDDVDLAGHQDAAWLLWSVSDDSTGVVSRPTFDWKKDDYYDD